MAVPAHEAETTATVMKSSKVPCMTLSQLFNNQTRANLPGSASCTLLTQDLGKPTEGAQPQPHSGSGDETLRVGTQGHRPLRAPQRTPRCVSRRVQRPDRELPLRHAPTCVHRSYPSRG